MRVYLIAAEGDADIADACGEYLRRQGCMVRIELGATFYSPARPGEMTVALWSMKTRMSAKQIMFTNRAIDALMTGTLVVGQLDFHPLPYGLTDVEPYDLRSPGMRQFQINKLLADLRKLQREQLSDTRPPGSDDGASGDDELEETPLSAPRTSGSDTDALSAPAPAAPISEASASDVFVSYAFANSEVVLPLIDSMQGSGTRIWIDREQLKPGTHWAGDIVRAIKATELFCLMCSAQSFASDHVRREIYLADKYDKPILPVKLDGAIMPEDIEYFLIDRQFLDMTNVDNSAKSAALRDALVA